MPEGTCLPGYRLSSYRDYFSVSHRQTTTTKIYFLKSFWFCDWNYYKEQIFRNRWTKYNNSRELYFFILWLVSDASPSTPTPNGLIKVWSLVSHSTAGPEIGIGWWSGSATPVRTQGPPASHLAVSRVSMMPATKPRHVSPSSRSLFTKP